MPDDRLLETPDTDSITRLVHGFYADVRRDPLLGPVFEAALQDRWDAHLARMVDFWSTVALGARSYRGNVMASHRPLPGVTPAHFAAWVRLWGEHTGRRFTPEAAHGLQQAAHGVARQLFRGMLGRLPDFAQDRHGGHGHSH
ncbi:group III truncated hemoglobin [Acidovorax sp. GBBC 3334]|uniref:group III truncated hemoglobin n=1 Tax=Acidovorax sp. GBBC 3334 TaxID=2940496 RepID=UPI0023044548|nr:group III truncated hemoglobin [Acidovorax sp. GBBC 3334]MDA8454238.1 group III truncated hemoglobin [Acidovorax sp. GBBC 3334]